ncbi:MAG: dihydroorotase [Campylobacterota bacterium]|nr:dihydroorotase [Campylobacterota bacterium]
MIISNALLCDITGERHCDLRIEEGFITEIAAKIEGDERIELDGAYLLPGLVDTNVRPRDGQINGATLERLAKKGLRGGITTVVLLPDSTPSIDNEIVLEFVQNQRYHEEGATLEASIATMNAEGGMSNIAILLKRGAVAPYVRSSAKNNTFCRIAEYAKMLDVTLFVRAEDESLAQDGVMNEGEVAGTLGLIGISPLSEILHVSRFIELARFYDIKIVFKSIVQPRSLELIKKAKSEGLHVQAEVSLHHLVLSDKACYDFNTTAKIDPPLIEESAMILLQEALKSGDIDMLTTLQQSQSAINKEVAFAEANYGSDSLGEALSLYYNKLVKSAWIDMPTLITLTCKNSAHSIAKVAGEIKVGQVCDMVVFDTRLSTKIENSNSLYNNEVLEGSVSMAFIDNEVIEFKE